MKRYKGLRVMRVVPSTYWGVVFHTYTNGPGRVAEEEWICKRAEQSIFDEAGLIIGKLG